MKSESRAREYIQKIDDMGGALAAIENGYMQAEIQDAAYRYQRAVESKEQVVVGVNAFQVKKKLKLERLKVDPAIEQNQRARLAAIACQAGCNQGSGIADQAGDSCPRQ